MNDPQLAQVRAHPFVIVAGGLLASALARNTWQLNLAPGILTVSHSIGIALRIIGVTVLFISYGSMTVAKTTINPSEHSSRLLTSGIYAYSRNPIYLGWFLIGAGIAFRSASLLVLATAVTMILLLYWAVVLHEEVYLETKFGEEYSSYKKRVRRWL